MQNAAGREGGRAVLALLRTFLLGATGLVCVRQTQVLTSVRVFLQELWGTGNQTPQWGQSSPSPPGRGGYTVQPQSNHDHLPEAGCSSGASAAVTGTNDPRRLWVQSHQAAATSCNLLNSAPLLIRSWQGKVVTAARVESSLGTVQ